MSIDRKTSIYGLKACELRLLKNTYQLSIAMCSHILLTCLWVRVYIVVIVAELGFILQYDTVQAPGDTLVHYLSLAGKLDKITSNSNSIFAGSAGFLFSG